MLQRTPRRGGCVRMEPMRKFATVLIASSLLLIVAGCGADDGTEPTELPSSSTSAEPSAPTTVPTTPSADAEEQAIIAAYKGFYSALNSLEDLSEPSVRAQMLPYTDGEALEKAVAAADGLAAKGYAPSGAVVFSVLEVALSNPDAAILWECRDASTEIIVDSASGQQISSGSPGTQIKAELARIDSTWKVTNLLVEEQMC